MALLLYTLVWKTSGLCAPACLSVCCEDFTGLIIRKSDGNFQRQSAVNPWEACSLIPSLHVIQKRTTLI